MKGNNAKKERNLLAHPCLVQDFLIYITENSWKQQHKGNDDKPYGVLAGWNKMMVMKT